jgi:hypothetical protein
LPNVNKRTKSQKSASAQQKVDALQRSNAEDKGIALQKPMRWQARTTSGTAMAWMAVQISGWYDREKLEAHFQEKHAMGWNKLARSTLSSNYLLGPEHEVRLWCGFCNMVMEASSKEK